MSEPITDKPILGEGGHPFQTKAKTAGDVIVGQMGYIHHEFTQNGVPMEGVFYAEKIGVMSSDPVFRIADRTIGANENGIVVPANTSMHQGTNRYIRPVAQPK